MILIKRNVKTIRFQNDLSSLKQDEYITTSTTSLPKNILNINKMEILLGVKMNNRWITISHYMVLLASDGQEMVYVSNPNGGENDNKSSGWYQYDETIS